MRTCLPSNGALALSLEAPNVLPFRSRSDAPVAVLPRPHFGIREPVTPAERAALGDRSHVCPTLDATLAAQWEMLAELAESLASKTRALGWLSQAVTAREIASIAETVAAEVSVEAR